MMDTDWPSLKSSISIKSTKCHVNELEIKVVKKMTVDQHKPKMTKSINVTEAILPSSSEKKYESQSKWRKEHKKRPRCFENKCDEQVHQTVIDSFNKKVFMNSMSMVRANLLAFYFSEMNIRRDSFMMSNMDDNGWIDVELVRGFKRLIRTRSTVNNVVHASSLFRLPPFSVKGDSVETVMLEIKSTDKVLIRRSDMSEFRTTFPSFEVDKNLDLNVKYAAPFMEYSFNYFEKELEPHIEKYLSCDNVNDIMDDTVIAFDLDVTGDGEQNSNESCIQFDFDTSPTYPHGNTKVQRIRKITMDSESDLDDSNVYLISLNPKMAEWDQVSDSDSVIDQIYPDSNKRDILRAELNEMYSTRTRYRSASSCSSYSSQDDLTYTDVIKMTNDKLKISVHKFTPLSVAEDTNSYDFVCESAVNSLHTPIENDTSSTLDSLLARVIFDCTKQNSVLNISNDIKVNKSLKSTKKSQIVKSNLKFYESEDDLNTVENPMMGYLCKNENRRKRTSSSSSYSQYKDAGYRLTHGLQIPNQNNVTERLLNDDFTFNLYKDVRTRALKDRIESGLGRSSEMNSLYRFWCFFLRQNKNKSMYREFQQYAWEDVQVGYRYGVECLFRMYTYKLEDAKLFTMNEYKDFQENVLKDIKCDSLYGLEKFWAFRFYGNDKLDVLPSIADKLNEYKTIEDFRRNFVPPQGYYGYRIRASS